MQQTRSKREVYSITSLPQEARKKNLKNQHNQPFNGIRKRRTNKVKVSRRTGIIISEQK